MMAAVPLSSASLLPLLECLEDEAAGLSEQTDAYITIANRLNGEEGRQFLPVVVKHFARLSKVLLVHISSENEELCQAALQALGFCVFHSLIVSVIPANISEDILSTLCNVVVKSKEKFTCTRALWVISKQNFPPEVASKKAPEILKSLEAMQTREVQSILIDHESLNVVIRLLEQAPSQMAAGAVCWAKLVIPLVVHSANKVRLRAAAALELGLPLLLEKQQEVAAIVEPMMSSMLIPEMQKLFASKNETNMLKLWPLFVKLLGKLLHKGGAFINSLLYLEELGFRNSSPNIKKIAFIAWKSLIDNFALNPDILCSSKRLKLLMQPLSSIQVRTEALLLTKLEVWWYLVVKLGPNLSTNFEQVGVPLLHSTLPPDPPLQSPTTPARTPNPSNGTPNTPKTGVPSCSTPSTTPRINLNSSMQSPQSYRSIQLLGLEMLLHWLVGPEVTAIAPKENLQLSLEPLTHPLLTSPSFFSRHASTLISATREGFITVGKHAPEVLLNLIWSNLIGSVSAAIEAGNKKERQGSEVLTLLLQALQSILSSDALPAERELLLLEATIKGIPQKVLGSAAYQVANMDVLNGTPALFLILLFYKSNQLSSFLEDERFFSSLETLVSCGFCGPTSPLAFGEAVLGAVSGRVEDVKNKKQLWRMWSVVVNPLTDTITQTNEVNQGDALEHNFSAIYSALMFPVFHLLPGSALPQVTQKAMISTWSRLYKAFARCSALVATAEENICCEELCAKISASLDSDSLKSLSMLDAIANILLIIIESIDFSPYTPQFQQKMKSPHTPLSWVRKRSKALGNLSTFHTLLMQTLDAFLSVDPSEESVEPTCGALNGLGLTVVSILSTLFTNITLPTFIQEVLFTLTKPLAQLYERFSSYDEPSKPSATLGHKLEKLATDLLGCLQTQLTLHNDEMIAVLSPLLCVLFPHKSKQIRTVVTQFWNATFGKALTLTYPEPLKSVLSQAKQKTPLILPGFEAVDAPDDCSGQYTGESSQLDPQISGVKMTSVGKRDSLLARAEELKGRGSVPVAKPVSMKLDFGSPKPLNREAIEEEASVDFVFIPPETKERVLTEHQKEVKRTKRVDIPALYNNLDASQDTSVFSQYTQSQEESMDKLTKDERDQPEEEPKVHLKEVTTSEEPSTDVKVTQGTTSDTPEKSMPNKAQTLENDRSPSSGISVDVSGHEKSGLEGTSPNVSSSSDMISGTPPKPNSRRQSFITLEKYVEGKSSPASVAFTGPPIRKSSRLDSSKSLECTPNDSQNQTTKEDSQKSQNISSTDPSAQNEKAREEDKDGIKSTGGHPCEGTDEEDLVPDTQTQVSSEASGVKSSPVSKASVEEQDSPEKDSQSFADSQSSQEPRRSSRRRSKPVRPGEDPGEVKGKEHVNQVADSTMTNTQKSVLAPPSSTLTGRRRSKVLEDTKVEGDQQKSKGMKSQSVSQIFSAESSQALPRASQTQSSPQSSPVTQSDSQSRERLPTLNESEGLSLGRLTKKTRTQLDESTDKEADENSENDPQNAASSLKKRHSQTPLSDSEADSQQTVRTRRTRRSESQLLEMSGLQTKEDLSQTDSQTVTMVKGRAMRRRTAEEETDSSRDVTSTVNADELSASQDSSQGLGRYRTRRSKGLLTTDNTESESPDSREDGPRPKKRLRKPLSTEVLPVATEPKFTEMVPDKEDVNIQSDVSIEMAQDEADLKPETSLGISVSETKEEQDDKEVLAPVSQPHEPISSEIVEIELKTDTDEKEIICDKGEGEEANSFSQAGSEDLKTDGLRKCPHTRGRGRGRRRSRSCNCFLNIQEVFSQNSDFQESQDLKNEEVPHAVDTQESQDLKNEQVPLAVDTQESQDLKNEQVPLAVDTQESQDLKNEQVPLAVDTQESQDLKNEQVPLDADTINSQPEQSSPTSVSEKSKSSAIADFPDADVQHFSDLPAQLLCEVSSSESPITKLGVIVSQLSEAEEGAQLELSNAMDESNNVFVKVLVVETNQLESSGCTDSPKHNKELDNPSVSQEPLQSSTPQDTSPSQGRPVEDASICQEQLESSHVQQEDAVKESEDLAVSETSGEKVVLPEESNGKELLDNNVALIEKDKDTQIDNQALSVDIQELSVLPQSSTSEACLDSPLKPKPLDALSGELEPGQSPSRNRSRVWSPSASPSTSILKKGQKRTCEEDTPSPLHKSRRVSFATPIYHQELADDIDRRSPVIRTSSPRSKVLSGQSKYITTPTKGYSSLSPRNLRSPGSKSSKKCLISEMSQEPHPIAKDCVYPALVGCSTPVEAVLPQISSNMWPRGFGQLVRARNIKTVGDLSALTPSEIKSLPIRSPKLSNVRKALKTYHEQQRKGRSDDLKSFDEMEKMTSEPEEMELPQNQDEEQTPGETQDDKPSEVGMDAGPMAEEKKCQDLLSDVVALGGRLTSEELGRCSPNHLGLMHEHLSGMMRSIVTHLQSRLLRNPDDSLP
ncbi:telomere-associated protein RIF1 isoform X5 [Ctenopharyngodon idella]|uniref:telomere-associated protein RIF1 isoform X3 n=1 Tax=Ctenopharyngodon idella TaxID=7959 RepID=UPI00222F86C5|nr:telomere-associated protein RIF1 isoform X3 [Ctenopharyngodon idella]XP_051760993.1 telomere-associated protein RIF1 isoform X4 [Ctenopharyngodon idella]XP_051760994.1 telomere-associated protein RIF1 isoform X5 [Ctenopharyngodon idella]